MAIRIIRESSDEHLQGILDLQKINLAHHLSQEEKNKEGFVTLRHDLTSLKKIKGGHSHIVGLNPSDEVIAYALVMLSEHKNEIPTLFPMFKIIDDLVYKNVPLTKSTYFIMGQVCIDAHYRGEGLFPELFNTLCLQMNPFCDFIITEISEENPRSLNAHLNYGFELIKSYTTPKGAWHIVLKEL